MSMLTNTSVAGVFRPSEKKRAAIYDIILIVGGSLLLGLCAQLTVQLPFSPVPVTGQTFAVLMIGMLLGARRGSLCVLAYLAEGTMGLPVFAMGRTGPAVLFGPTGGYLVGFAAAAYVTGLLAEKGWDRKVGTTILAMILGNVCIYAFGLFWLTCLTNIKTAVTVGLYPFVVGEVLKIALAVAILPTGWKLLNSKLADRID